MAQLNANAETRSTIAIEPPGEASTSLPTPTRTQKSISDPEVRQVSDPPETDESSPPQMELFTASLPLSKSISIALAQNPDLIALRQNERVGAATLGVAQTYPFNPFVQIQVTPFQNPPQGASNATHYYVLLMQTIQLAHQQRFREDGAAFALNSIRWNIHQAELLNVAQTETFYFTALYQRGILELAVANHENNQRLLTTLEKQLAAGQATSADVAIVRVDARATQRQASLAQTTYQTSLRDLRRHLGLAPDSPVNLVGDLRTIKWRLPANESPEAPANAKTLAINWASTRPDVMAARSDIDVARANLHLASANRVPDLQIGPYYQRTADTTTFVGLRAQMDIPVINSGKPLESQRGAELDQRVATWRQALTRAELEAQAAIERYELAFKTLEEDGPQGQGIGDLPQELQSLEQQFLEGEVDIARVVQARTSIIQNQRARLDLLNELAQAAANLTGATGIPLEVLLQDK